MSYPGTPAPQPGPPPDPATQYAPPPGYQPTQAYPPPAPGSYQAPAPGPYPPPAPGAYPASAPTQLPAPVPPVVAPQTATVPVTGVPFSIPPVSAAPGYGYPMGAPEPALRRGRATLLLAILTGVFFLASVVFVTMYVTETSAYDRQVSMVRQRNSTIVDLQNQLRQTKDQLGTAQQQQSGTQNQLNEITTEKQIISNCLNLYSKVVDALINNDKNTFNANFNTMKTACDQASQYLN